MSPLLSALIGGVMIGGSAALLYLLHGRIAGISGILGSAVAPETVDREWRVAFVGGLLLAGVAFRLLAPSAVPVGGTGTPLPLLAVAGVIVGFGTRMGNGCTSGHGVCGIGRGSARSIWATGTFMAVAIAVVFVMRHVIGGA